MTQTIVEVCEYVSNWLKVKHGKDVSPEGVYNLSPTGELFPVYDLFNRARREMGDAECRCDKNGEKAGDLCVKCDRLWTGQEWIG